MGITRTRVDVHSDSPSTPKGNTVKVLTNTEVWNRSTGKVAKAVFRDTKGRFLPQTNQTAEVAVGKTVRPRVTLTVR